MTSQMVNTEFNVNIIGLAGIVSPSPDKQLSDAPKKTALRDSRNENMGAMHKQQENLLPGLVRSTGNAIKVSGTKRLTPEHPSSSQNLPSLTHNGTNENVMNARRRFELELGRGRLQNNVEKFSDCPQFKKIGLSRQEMPSKTGQVKDTNIHHAHVVTSNNMTSINAISSTSPSIPSSLGKLINNTQAVKVIPEAPRVVDCKSTSDHLRTERYMRLQKFLKQCDETNQKEYMQPLLNLPPSELSKRAVDLEKRAIELTLRERNEMQRKMTLNILPTPSPSNTLLQKTHPQPSKS